MVKSNPEDLKRKKKRRNRGRNKDGGLLSVLAGTSSTTLLILLVIVMRRGYEPSWMVSLPGVILSAIGISGYYIQSNNRMTREARIGLFESLPSLVAHISIILTAF